MVNFAFSEFDIDAAISFTSTTIDDFAVMLYFFSIAEQMHDVERSRRYVSILVSFILGYTIVGITALLSLLLGVVLTREYIALAGFIPLFAGIHKVYETLVEKNVISPCSCSCSCFGCICCGMCNDNDDKDGRGRGLGHDRSSVSDDDYTSLSVRDRSHSSSSSSSDDSSPESSPSKFGSGSGSGRRKNSRGYRKKKNDNNDNDNDDVEMANVGNNNNNKSKPAQGKGNSNYSGPLHDNNDNDNDDGHGSMNKNKMTLNDSSHSDHDDYYSSSDDEYGISVQHSINHAKKKFLGMFTWDIFWKHWRDPLDWEVLMITLASGSDHVVIYNALMELETAGWQISLTVIIYYIILILHTICAVWLIRCQWIARIFQKYSILLIICLMIGTGVYILKDSVLFVVPGTSEH